MNVNIEIIDSSYIYAQKEIEELNTKILVPKMVFRRRLTRAAKICVYLADQVGFKTGRIMYGSAFGEVPATSNILNAISLDEPISPTDFQNSVYNTAVSYLSILHGNTDEIMTISSGDMTSDKIIKMGIVKALDGDELLLMATETLNIENISEVNQCIDYLECGVALKIKISKLDATVDYKDIDITSLKGFPPSLQHMLALAKNHLETKQNIIQISL